MQPFIYEQYNKIFGLTGTLGSIPEQNLLSAIYKVNYAKIPTYKTKNFNEYSGVVVEDADWDSYVAIDAIEKCEQGRAVLIICETIDDLKKVEKNLEILKKIKILDSPENAALFDGIELDDTSPKGLGLSQQELATPLQTESFQLDQEARNNAFNQKENQSYEYQATDIRLIQKQLIRPYLSDFIIHEPIGNERSIDQILAGLITSLREDKPTLCIYNLDDLHWVTFAALKIEDATYILYKDSKGTRNKVLEQQITKINNTAIFIANQEREQTEGLECGIFALQNMEIMARRIKHNKEGFVKEFADFKEFCSLKDVQNLRAGDFAKKYVLGKYQEMVVEAIKLDKLQKLREQHSDEARAIESKLKEDKFFKDFTVKVLASNEDSSDSVNTITVEIATYPDTDLESINYVYGYRISISNNLSNRSKEIFSNVCKVLQTANQPSSGDRAIVFTANDVPSIIQTPNRAIEGRDEPSIAISELLENLFIGNHAALRSEVERILADSRYSVVIDYLTNGTGQVTQNLNINQQDNDKEITQTKDTRVEEERKGTIIDFNVKTFPDEDSVTVTEAEVKPRDIIIATNIAGRGTDLKTTNDLEYNGGLHVCVGFLPCNKRVEEQAFGRTSRQGKDGTAQLIIKQSEVEKLGVSSDNLTSLDVELIKKFRDKNEKKRVEEIQSIKLCELDFNDTLFNYFSDLYKELKESHDEDIGFLFVLCDLKEFWAFWLEKQDFKGVGLTKERVQKEFEVFKLEAKEIIGGTIKHNPYYSVKQAESFLQSDNKTEEALKSLMHAIHISNNPEILYSAHVKLFEVAIEKGGQLMERFKAAVAAVFFIKVTKDETYKENGLEHLKAAKCALEKEIHYISSLLTQESDLNKVLIRFEDGQENPFLKHLSSRLTCLHTYLNNIDGLSKQITGSNEQTEDGQSIPAVAKIKGGVAIGSRVADYLKKLDLKKDQEKKLKESITDSEVSELGFVGLDAICALKEVHDAHPEVISRAQGQIAGGFASLAIGFAFPPALSVCGPIAGTLISEGICDIVMELISKGDSEFSEAEYAKGKVISYGISIAIMGINAIATSMKVLSEASKACKALSEILRKSPFMKTICEKVANQIDKLGKWFDKLHLEQFNKLGTVKQLEHLEKLQKAGKLEELKHLGDIAKLNELQHLKNVGVLKELSRMEHLSLTLKNIATETIQGVVGSVVMEKMVTTGLQELFKGIKPLIKEQVRNTISSNAELTNQLKSEKLEEIYKITRKILEGELNEIISEVAQEIALGVARHSNNWKAKLTSLALDSIISIDKIIKYPKEFCKKLSNKLNGSHANNNIIDEIVEELSEQVTEKIYGLVIHLTGKHAHTLVVGPIMHKLYNLNAPHDGHDKVLEDTLVIDSRKQHSIIEHDPYAKAYKDLGLQLGATDREIKKAYRKAALETHPDKHPNDPYAKDKFQTVCDAYERLVARTKVVPHASPPHESEHEGKHGIPSSNNDTASKLIKQDHDISSRNPNAYTSRTIEPQKQPAAIADGNAGVDTCADLKRTIDNKSPLVNAGLEVSSQQKTRNDSMFVEATDACSVIDLIGMPKGNFTFPRTDDIGMDNTCIQAALAGALGVSVSSLSLPTGGLGIGPQGYDYIKTLSDLNRKIVVKSTVTNKDDIIKLVNQGSKFLLMVHPKSAGVGHVVNGEIDTNGNVIVRDHGQQAPYPSRIGLETKSEYEARGKQEEARFDKVGEPQELAKFLSENNYNLFGIIKLSDPATTDLSLSHERERSSPNMGDGEPFGGKREIYVQQGSFSKKRKTNYGEEDIAEMPCLFSPGSGSVHEALCEHTQQRIEGFCQILLLAEKLQEISGKFIKVKKAAYYQDVQGIKTSPQHKDQGVGTVNTSSFQAFDLNTSVEKGKRSILEIDMLNCSEIDAAHIVGIDLNFPNVNSIAQRHLKEVLDRTISKTNRLPKPFNIGPDKIIDDAQFEFANEYLSCNSKGIKNIKDIMKKYVEHCEKKFNEVLKTKMGSEKEVFEYYSKHFENQRITWNNLSDVLEKLVKKTQESVDNEATSVSSASLSGLNNEKLTNIGCIDSYFSKYTLEAIKNILALRIDGVGLENLEILQGHYIFQENYNNISKMLNDLINTQSGIVLVPLNLHNRHAVGIMYVKDQEGNSILYYIDPSNEVIPHELNQIFIENSLKVEQLSVEQQKYGNCGPEVIEDFMLYLTGERLSQEEAVPFHSQLLEQTLLGNI
ncbi:MAG: hypothetical protein DMENIID0002_03300 [Rickettsia endosymbiont of Sergentomyia squamirostris]|uniref:Protein translocase subunit SecA n=1 Tax=Candidatus Tisiphia endosymbiont of Sergentomyia squamirostris TaxID=3113639 RepID=A0AAT9G7A9_9RICK